MGIWKDAASKQILHWFPFTRPLCVHWPPIPVVSPKKQGLSEGVSRGVYLGGALGPQPCPSWVFFWGKENLPKKKRNLIPTEPLKTFENRIMQKTNKQRNPRREKKGIQWKQGKQGRGGSAVSKKVSREFPHRVPGPLLWHSGDTLETPSVEKKKPYTTLL